MENINEYKIKIDNIIYFVYSGFCNGIPTKWVLAKKWDKSINIKFENGELIYFDDTGNEILVFENDEPEYHKF